MDLNNSAVWSVTVGETSTLVHIQPQSSLWHVTLAACGQFMSSFYV